MNRKEVSEILDGFGLINQYAHIHKGGLWSTKEEIMSVDTYSIIIVEMPKYTILALEDNGARHLKTMKIDECNREDILNFVRECNFPGFDKVYRNLQLKELDI